MLKKFNDLTQLNNVAAELFVEAAQSAVAKNGRFTVALTGGSSPTGLYRLLATPEYRDRISWDQVFVFWGDERWVPLNDERSNARMAFDTLLSHVPVPETQVFPMWAEEVSPEGYAAGYERLVRQHVPDGCFDMILLGMGPDGHTASWFPGTEVLHERTKWVAAYYLAAQEMHRITLTVPLVNQAKQLVVMAFGAGKADALHEVLKGSHDPEKYPAQLLEDDGRRLTWLVDEAAAARV